MSFFQSGFSAKRGVFMLVSFLVVGAGFGVPFGARAAESSNVIFSDDFNDNSIDSTKWTTEGARVFEQDGVMNVTTDVTDAGGKLSSKWFPINGTQPITISRKTLQHYGNETHVGFFRMYFDANNDGVPDVQFGLNYANNSVAINYGNNYSYCARHGIFLDNITATNLTGIYCNAIVSPVVPGIWDTWFNEELTYDPVSGLVSYRINGEQQTTLNVGALLPSASYRMQLFDQAWGWYTGHYNHFDDVSVTQSTADNNCHAVEAQWLAQIHPQETVIPLSTAIKDGRAYIPPYNTWTGWSLSIPQFIDGDNVRIDIRMKAPLSEGAIPARDPSVGIVGTSGDAQEQWMADSWGLSWTGLHAGNTNVIGDINGMVQNFDDWHVISMQLRDSRVSTMYDSQMAYSMPYTGSIGILKAIGFGFKGSGSVDWVRIYQDDMLVFDEEFNADGQSTAVVCGDAPAPFTCGTSTVQDVDGNTYGTTDVNGQCWMTENMRAGTMVTGATTQTDNGTIEKYCYNNDPANCTTDGGLYQWDEAMQHSTTEGAQGICPAGWHVPTDAEQYALENYLKNPGATCDANRINGSSTWDCDGAGTKMKSGTPPGLNFPLNGYRNTDGTFNARTTTPSADIWSSSQTGTSAWNHSLYSAATVGRGTSLKTFGLTVRCLRDSDVSEPANHAPVITDLKQYYTSFDGEWHEITEGGHTETLNVVLVALADDVDADKYHFEFELRPAQEAFTGTGDAVHSTGIIMQSGSTEMPITVQGGGNYHWRVRAVDENEAKSEWKEFGNTGVGNVDFVVNTTEAQATLFVQDVLYFSQGLKTDGTRIAKEHSNPAEFLENNTLAEYNASTDHSYVSLGKDGDMILRLPFPVRGISDVVVREVDDQRDLSSPDTKERVAISLAPDMQNWRRIGTAESDNREEGLRTVSVSDGDYSQCSYYIRLRDTSDVADVDGFDLNKLAVNYRERCGGWFDSDSMKTPVAFFSPGTADAFSSTVDITFDTFNSDFRYNNNVGVYKFDWDDDGIFDAVSDWVLVQHSWSTRCFHEPVEQVDVALEVEGKDGRTGVYKTPISLKKGGWVANTINCWNSSDDISKNVLKKIEYVDRAMRDLDKDGKADTGAYLDWARPEGNEWKWLEDRDIIRILQQEIPGQGGNHLTYLAYLNDAMLEEDMIHKVIKDSASPSLSVLRKGYAHFIDSGNIWTGNAEETVTQALAALKMPASSAGFSSLMTVVTLVKLGVDIDNFFEKEDIFFALEAYFRYGGWNADTQGFITKHIHETIKKTIDDSALYSQTENELKEYFAHLYSIYGEAKEENVGLTALFIQQNRKKFTEFTRDAIVTHVISAVPRTLIWVESPVELRVRDSEGHVTGLSNGVLKEEISQSVYDPEREMVMVMGQNTNLSYELYGLDNGTYNFFIKPVGEDPKLSVSLSNIRTSVGEVHEITVDSDALLMGSPDAVQISIDKNGDGTSERFVKVGNNFSDTIAPTTTPIISSALGHSGWYKDTITVKLSATDNDGGVGVKGTKYSLDNGATWNTYADPFAISEEGMHTIQFYSEDWFENKEETKSQDIKIDKTAPEVAITNPTNNATLYGSVDIKGSVTDINPDHYELTLLDSSGALIFGSDEVSKTNSFTDEHLVDWDTTKIPDGVYVMKLEAEDLAGNKGGNSIVVTLNNTPDNKDQCKDDEWKNFYVPKFKNQGDCVSFIESNSSAKSNKTK